MEENIFFYYLKPFLKIVLFIVLLIFCSFPFAMLAQIGFLANLAQQIIPIYQEVLQEIILLIIVLSAILMIFKLLPHYNWPDIFVRKQEVFSGFLKGTAIGLVIMLICAAILYGLSAVSFTVGNINPFQLFSYFLLLLVVSVFEEFLFRSFPLIVFAERYPLILTLLINGLLFGFAHLGNPGFTTLAMINIALAGCLFSIFTLHKWNLSWAIGLHFGWNFTQGALLGYNVSGLPKDGILAAKPLGDVWLSGGNFGIEGSIICTIVLLTLITGFFIKYKLHPLARVVDENETEELTNEFSR